MAELQFELKDGITTPDGKKQTLVVLREATANDIIEASLESERVVMTPQGPQLLVSPTLIASNVARRRIVSIGSLQKVDMTTYRELSAADMSIITAQADLMDMARDKEVAKRLAEMGRAEGAGDAG